MLRRSAIFAMTVAFLLVGGCAQIPPSPQQQQAAATKAYLVSIGQKLETKNIRTNDRKEAAKQVRQLAWELSRLPAQNVDPRVVEWNSKLITLLMETADLAEDLAEFEDLGSAFAKGLVTGAIDIFLFGGVPVTTGALVVDTLDSGRHLQARQATLKRKLQELETETVKLHMYLQQTYGFNFD